MWLPDTFYEKAPHYWLVLGVLFILFGIYMGLEMAPGYLVIGVSVGLACCAWSALVFSKRARNRKPDDFEVSVVQAEQSEASEQT